MKKILFFFSFLTCFITKDVFAQPALNSIPIGIGRDNCGSWSYGSGLQLFVSGDFRSGGSWNEATQSGDSVYFFKYAAAALSKSTTLNSMLPRLKIGGTTYTGRINGGSSKIYRDRFTPSDASISFNPRDGMVYYIWTDYGLTASATLKSYVWRFPPDTTFAPGSIIPYNTGAAPGIPALSVALLDTFKSFAFDIGGVTFDNNGTTWQLEFSNPPAPYKSRLRKMNFATGFIDPVPDTLVLQPTTGRGSTMYNVGSGDITLLPNGQMYYVFDNKLYTPDYGSYGGSTKKINSYYIDTIRKPTGATNLVGLSFGDGDLISSYSPGCIYRRIDPITGDTNYVNYTYLANKGVQSYDMTQLASGIGVSKKLVSIAPTGTAKQYDVVYDVFVKNYGTTLLTNIQVKDSLGGINGNGNVSNVTTTMMTIPPPPGIALNGAFNGVSNTNLLQSTGQNLPNYPTDSSSFTIRINCRMNNIDTGVVYYNSAVGFATGYKGVPLRDSSTNGPTPDLNQNDKPDDVGESVPTPFLIALTGTRGGCGTLTATLYSENFGPGTGPLSTALPGSFITTYTGSTTEPIARNTYTLTNNAKNADTTNFVSMADHTTGTGNMMVFNADAPPRVFFRDTMPTSCPGRQYSLTFWTAFPANSTYATACSGLGGFRYPKVKMRMIDIATGLDVVTLTTDSFYSPGWTQKGMRWTMPRGYSNLIMELSNAAPGGCGNDMVLDDIVYGTCDALPLVNASSISGCLGDSIRFVGSLSDSTVLPGPKDHQWQVAPAAGGPWTDISGATLPYLVINPILPSDTGKFYRLIVAAQGSINIGICRSISPGVKLTGQKPSTAPSSITAPSSTICSGSSVTLTANGGILGSGANYQWGTGSTIGTSPIAGATSSTYTVSPTTTTTYWVRIENTSSPCASSTGGTTLVVNVTQPSAAPTSVTGADICNGGTTTLTALGGTLGSGANYQWGTGSTPGTNPIAGATSSTYTVSPTVTTTYWVKIKNTTSPCADSTAGLTKTITVSQPSAAPTSVTGADICNGGTTTLTALGGTLGSGATYQWGTGSTPGSNPIAGATSSTYTVSPTVTTTYWVKIKNTTSPCSDSTAGLTKTITVSQPSAAPTSVTGADICNGGSTTLTALGGTLGTGANYQWGTGSTPGSNPIAGATSSTYTVSPTVTTTYWVKIKNTTSPCSDSTAGLTKTITVSQPSAAPTSVTGANICNGGTTTLTALGGTLGSGANYQWGTGSTPGSNPIAGATSSTYTVSPTVTTTYWVKIKNTTSPCADSTVGLTKTITVSQPSAAPTSVTGADICNGSSTTLTALGGTLGTGANYQWGTGSTPGSNPIAGATSSTYTVSPTVTTTYWVKIKNTTSPCADSTAGLTKTITVSQPSSAPTSVTGADICNGSSTTLTALGGTLGSGANYQWGTGSTPGSNPIAGATSSTYTVSPTVTTTYWVKIKNTTSPCSDSTAGLTKTITVSQPSAAPTSVTGADICNGSSTTLTALGGTLGTGANYQWGTGSTPGSNPIAGATSSTYTVSPTVTTTYWVKIKNTTSPCSDSTAGLTKTITVSQPSAAPTSVTGADICNGGTTTLTASGGVLGTGANYQWGTGSTVGTSPIAGATSSTYTVSPTTTTTYWVRIQNGTAPCSATTTGLTKTITVSQPSVSPASITAPSTTICNGSSVLLTSNGATLGTGANYQWGTGSTVGVSPIAGATSSTYSVSPTTTTTYWVRVENTASPCSSTTGGTTLTITVNQPSAAPTSVTGADICNGSSTTLTASGGVLGTGANYQWGTGSTVGTSPIAGATSSTYTVSPTTTTTYWVRIQNGTAPCSATTTGLTKTITVSQPSVAPTSVTGADICNSGSTTLTASGGTLGTGANYQWGTGSTVGVSPIAGATSSTLTVSPSSTTTYWVQIQNGTAPCSPTTTGLTKVITVSQSSVAPTAVTGSDICNGSSTTLTASGGTLGSGANYQWGTGSTVGVSPIAGATSSTLTVSPSSTTTYWVRIENGIAPCAATTTGLTKVITVSQPSVSATAAGKNKNNICPGIAVKIFRTGGTLGTGATWKWYTGSPGGTLVGTGDTLTFTPSVTTTYYLRAEGSCNTTPAQSVTVFISCDIDKDKDGIPDIVESNLPVALQDANSNGIINAYDLTYAAFKDTNNDYIDDDFQADGDSDNDGIPNYLDTDFAGRIDIGGPGGATVPDGIDDRFDRDLDGIINMLDLDSDNDGIPDVVEAYGVDTNGDGQIDNFSDTDGDGLSQNVDVNNTGAYNTGLGLGNIDFDKDGVPNYLDLDSDNDGIPDLVETGGADTNNNGKVDVFADANGNGLADGYELGTGTPLLLTGPDAISPFNGRADNYPNKNKDYDFRPNAYDRDSDGDGIVDVKESGLPDVAPLDGIIDGTINSSNGWSTTTQALPSLNLRDTDSDGKPNYVDIDSDNDGIPDNVEGQTTNGYALPGTTDVDGDGLIDTYDTVNGNTGPGFVFGGSGILLIDTDADGTPDYMDLDTDGDGQPDIVEGNDFNLNNRADDIVTLTGLDFDGDGLDDRFDSSNVVNSAIGMKGTSWNMATGGALPTVGGDPNPGARCPLTKKKPADTDRAWRFLSSVLPVQILAFTGSPQGSNVLLNWTIITEKDIDRFEIERSVTNSNYSKIGTVQKPVQLGIAQSFDYTDDITNITSDVIYYRLKVINKNGEITYSNVLVVRKLQPKNVFTIMPNPATDYVSVNMYAKASTEAIVRLMDETGRTVLLQKQKVVKGTNVFQINNLAKYPSGTYIIQIIANDDVAVQRLVISR